MMLITDQEMMEISFIVVAPPGNILELYIDASEENPSQVNSHRQSIVHLFKGRSHHMLREWITPVQRCDTYHEGGTSYADADNHDAGPNLII